MFRHNQIIGCCMTVFAIGLLVGMWIEGGFFAHVFGVVFIIAGCSMLRKK